MRHTFWIAGLFCVVMGFALAAQPNTLPMDKKIKVLHVSFHQGCINEFKGVAEHLSLDPTNWYVHDLPPGFFDGNSSGSVLYNMGHERAKNIWEQHKDFFNKFDVVLVSDTAPLSRIFLQNNFQKKLIIWICNRFDYYDGASLDCDFPDHEYYELMRKASKLSNVAIVAYTPFEHAYARSKNVDTGSLVIKPSGACMDGGQQGATTSTDSTNETFFLPPYHNETIFTDLSRDLKALDIPNFSGRYNGPDALKQYKAIIHLPYAWSNLALFENIKNGIPYFIPTISFMEKLQQRGDYSFQNAQSNLYTLSEWYCPEHKDLFIYFDSWPDLKQKIAHTDYQRARRNIAHFGQKHFEKTIEQWDQLFKRLTQQGS